MKDFYTDTQENKDYRRLSWGVFKYLCLKNGVKSFSSLKVYVSLIDFFNLYFCPNVNNEDEAYLKVCEIALKEDIYYPEKTASLETVLVYIENFNKNSHRLTQLNKPN